MNYYLKSLLKNYKHYPFSNQATTIKNVLLNEIENKKIKIRHDVLVTKVIKKDNYFEIETENEIIKADKVIIATGSCASPKTGSDGIGYKLLKRFNHHIIEPYPALVQLKTKGPYLKDWAGVRTDVKVSLYEDNNLIKEESGEIQLTDYGISGICVFNLSRYIPLGLNNGKKEEIIINFLPFIENNIKELFKTNNSVKKQLEAILNNKLVNVILRKTNINEKLSFNELKDNDQALLIDNLTNFKVEVIGYNSFDNSQVASGGLSLTEINLETMESTLVEGLYIVGELLDVDGDCGGYNLGFAWMSGIKAGKDISNND